MKMNSEIEKLINSMSLECERLMMKDIRIYNVKDYSPLTDIVFIATAGHILQLNAARESISLIAKKMGIILQNPTEDYSEGWLAMDFVDLIVHILVKDKRSFYDLDGLMESIIELKEPSFSKIDIEEHHKCLEIDN